MGLIKEPKNVDFSTQSEPWTEQELVEFRALMQQLKAKNAQRLPPAKKATRQKVNEISPYPGAKTAP